MRLAAAPRPTTAHLGIVASPETWPIAYAALSPQSRAESPAPVAEPYDATRLTFGVRRPRVTARFFGTRTLAPSMADSRP